MNNKTMMTDFYELTMAQTYFKEGKKDEILYFDLFFRKNPFNGGYTVANGLDEIIEYVENFKFEDKEIDYLRSLGKFDDKFLDYLKDYRFKGDIYAVPNGTMVFPNEPCLTVRGDAIGAQILETALLAAFNHGSLVSTSSKRICNEAGVPVMEFGARRAPGIDAAILASKYAYIAGCAGTSNTVAGMKYGIPVLGTMAHSLVTEANSEYDAFLGYAKGNPNNTVFLVDTYDTLRSGIPNAIKVADSYLKPNGFKFNGIRIDSGDLAYLSKEARKMLDFRGYADTGICLSNGLNEYTIRDLKAQGASFNSLGVGDNITSSCDRVGAVYKLVAVEENGEIKPRIKVSNDSIKTITPGYKKVYRFYDKESGYALGDVITLYDCNIPLDGYTLVHPVDTWKRTHIENYDVRPLLVPIFINGKLVYEQPSLEETKVYCNKDYESLYPEVRRINNPHEYYVDLSDELRALKQMLIESHRKELSDINTDKEKSYEKKLINNKVKK